MKKTLVLIISIMIVSCVSGPPILTPVQWKHYDDMEVYADGESLSKKYTEIAEISAVDCPGAPSGSRVWGKSERAMQTLKMKAAAQNADAIIVTSCSYVPFMNNCWAGNMCSGTAVKWSE